LNRREFIAGGVASVGLFGSASACADQGDGRILLGACRCLGDVPLLKSVGFDYFEDGVSSALDPEKDDEWWKSQKETILSAALPMRACNGFIPGKFRLTGPNADHEPALRYAEKALRRADEVGVRFVVFGSGGARNVPGDFALGGKQRPDVQKGVAQFTDFCRELCRRTSDLADAVIVIEPLCPNESNIVNYVWQGVQICQDVGSPRLAQLADFYHMMAGRESAESIVKALGRIRHCHVASYGKREFPGKVPATDSRLKPYFDALKAIGYRGGVSCECGWGDAKHLGENLETALTTMKGLI